MAKKSTHPVVGGVETTYQVLSQALGITRQAAALRYKRNKAIHGKVSAEMMVHSKIVDPATVMIQRIKLAEFERQNILRHARLHGAIHTSMVYGIPESEVRAIVQADE